MFIKRLKEMRVKKNLSQKDIAKILNISQQQYSLYETGKRLIPTNYICILADFYNTSIDYLVNMTNKKNLIQKSLRNNLIVGVFNV